MAVPRLPLSLLAGLLLVLAGCASPAARVDAQARDQGLARAEVAGDGFVHVAYLKRPEAGTGPVHVYLEHDGLPWATDTRVSTDPTPRNPLMLRLMAGDPAPSVYLGRPCYFGLATAPGCGPRLWTHERYSGPIVRSMQAALVRLVGTERPVVLLGHSGGGSLALLMAEGLPQVRAVVTLAGNLDTDAWARHHGYTPLAGSLNPARRPPLDARIVQRHYLGADDRQVPPEVVAAFTRSRPAGEVVLVPGADHQCCWDALWPQVLDDLEQHLATAWAGPR